MTKKLCLVLIKFNKAVQGNISKPLRNLYTKFDVNTLRHCGEMAWVEEHLHTFGNSDIATLRRQADRERKRAARQQATESRRSQCPQETPEERSVCVYHVSLREASSAYVYIDR